MSKLLIVESPTKVKSIKKYLGGDYKVMASMGHIRDLPKSKLGVDIEKDFAPQYSNLPEKKEFTAPKKNERQSRQINPFSSLGLTLGNNFKLDKDITLVLGLLLILANEKADRKLLLALLYILM